MKEFKVSRGITVRTEGLDRYLAEISRQPMVSIDEEIALAQDIRKGGRRGERARNRLVNANLRFVVSVAKQYQHKGLMLQDLIDEGNIGLVKAAERFDETRGFKFISFAVWWIRQSIMQAVAVNSRMVRLPLNQVGALHKISKAIAEFLQSHNRQPSLEELAELTGMDEEKIASTLSADNRHMSLDLPVADDNDSTVADMMSGAEEMRTDRYADFESMSADLHAVLNNVLNKRERDIVIQCFGIGGPERSLEEIGSEMGLTRECVRQIREKSIEKIRLSGNARLLMKYLG